jgi:hypothetical protein
VIFPLYLFGRRISRLRIHLRRKSWRRESELFDTNLVSVQEEAIRKGKNEEDVSLLKVPTEEELVCVL